MTTPFQSPDCADLAVALIDIEVVHAAETGLWRAALQVRPGTTVAQAIDASGFRQAFPDLDPMQCRVGIYSRVRAADWPVQARDRIEIYRPLKADPKHARRQRAADRPTRRG